MRVKINEKPDVLLYCQVGRSLDMFKWSVDMAIQKAGDVKFALLCICWKTSEEVYQYLKDNDIEWFDMEYEEGKGFLYNLYKGWNSGYWEGYKYSDYIVPIATDHSYFDNWLSNLYKHKKENRIINTKLIEPGILPSIHSTYNFGSIGEEFDQKEFERICNTIKLDVLITNDKKYGHRLDAMPFLVPKDVWERFGPMNHGLTTQYIDNAGFHTGLTNSCTGDTDFFIRCKNGGVEITKALDAISYHAGGVETKRNTEKGNIYT